MILRSHINTLKVAQGYFFNFNLVQGQYHSVTLGSERKLCQHSNKVVSPATCIHVAIVRQWDIWITKQWLLLQNSYWKGKHYSFPHREREVMEDAIGQYRSVLTTYICMYACVSQQFIATSLEIPKAYHTEIYTGLVRLNNLNKQGGRNLFKRCMIEAHPSKCNSCTSLTYSNKGACMDITFSLTASSNVLSLVCY